MSDNPFDIPLATTEITADSADVPCFDYCLKSVEETIDKQQTDPKSGLSSQQDIIYRQTIHGLNELEQEEDEPLYLKFVKQFYEDPLILLLNGSAIISFIMGNIDDAVSITVAIVIVVTVGFIQEYRSEKSLEALNKLVPPNCYLTRNGNTETKLASNLVPGDLVHLHVGDRVPADIRIINSTDLAIDESNLTGEGDPVSKNPKTIHQEIANAKIQISDCTNIAFMGTLVRDGNAAGIVVATGSNTVFGHIFKMMSDIEKPKTPLQVTMDKLGKQLSLISFVIIGVICIIGIIEGKSWLDMFQISVSLAVAAIPEGLPIIVTVTLALGVLRMASHKAIVRRLPSVETLGSVNVLCTDKTGTLTENHMTVTKLWTPEQGVIDLNDNHDSGYNNRHNSGIFDEATFEDRLTSDVSQLLEIGNICNNSKFSSGTEKFVGNPTDIALAEVLKKFKMDDIRPTREKLKELSFNSLRKYMAVTVHKGDKMKPETFVKGAYERILRFSTHVTTNNGKHQKITDELKSTVIAKANELASQGLRVLAFAKKDGDFDFSKDPTNLVFAGLVGMYDPPRKAVPGAVAQFVKGGVHVIMITGDSEATATSIAKQVGLYIQDTSRQVLSGDKLDSMTDDELAAAIQYVNVFARSTPAHKVRIVKALQQRGDVVAMTGDGVNDAPALKLADIGIAMGKNGTDVAKEAADMILVNDDFTTILTAIEEGKGIFYNIQNFLCFQLSTSVGALGLVAITTFLNLPNPLNPMMILFINIIMDGPPAQSLGVEAVDDDIMNHPPRLKHENILSQRLLQRIALKGLITVFGTIFIYSREIRDSVTKRDTTMTFATFVCFDMWNAISCKHNFKSIFQVGFFRNKFFNVSILIIILAQLSIIYLPIFQNIFQTEALYFGDMIYIIAVTSSVFVADEIFKFFITNNERLLGSSLMV